jgi:hypothetical protein
MNDNSHTVRWITPDLMDSVAVALPLTFQLKPGSVVNITFPDGRTGSLTVASEPKPDHYRGRWTWVGSKYDDRDFDLSWGTRSDISPVGQPIRVPLIMVVVP